MNFLRTGRFLLVLVFLIQGAALWQTTFLFPESACLEWCTASEEPDAESGDAEEQGSQMVFFTMLSPTALPDCNPTAEEDEAGFRYPSSLSGLREAPLPPTPPPNRQALQALPGSSPA